MQAWNSTAIEPVREYPTSEIWLRWVAFTGLGYLVYGALAIGLPAMVGGNLLASPIAGILGMAVVGFLQWFVLQRYIYHMRWLGWIVATVLGKLVGSILGATSTILITFGLLGSLPDDVDVMAARSVIMLLTGAVIGAVIGLAQYLVLRGYIRGAIWWIPASIAAFALTGPLPLLGNPNFGLGLKAGVIITEALTGVMLGAITGIVLASLLRKPVRGVQAVVGS